MDDESLVQTAALIRAEADRLMRDLDLVGQLHRYGEVAAAGSYRWDLMTRGDLDFYVINPAADLDLVLTAIDGMIRRGDFLRFGFIDSVRGMPPWHVPAGYYLGMEREYEGRTWRVETWFLRARLPNTDWIEKRMTEEARRTILRLKCLREDGGLDIRSYHIYKAVLLGGARQADEVRTWVAEERARGSLDD